MTRPTYKPIYEESEADIQERVLGNIDPSWRTEPGDFMYDAVAPAPPEIKQLEAKLDEVFKQATAIYAEDNFLDLKLSEIGLTRNPATSNKRRLNIKAAAGVYIPAGHNLSVILLDANSNPIEYVTDIDTRFSTAGTLAVDITCKTLGIEGNIPTGSDFIMQPPIIGVETITDTGSTVLGAEAEDDDSAYKRYQERLQKPDTGGNKNDYVRWSTSIAGVGKAKCKPRWNGNGTVKVILTDTDFMPASAAIVKDVQDYLDPGSTGLGDGKAPCGALVTVVAATALTINIMATITTYSGVSKGDVTTAFSKVVKDYLAAIAFTGSDVTLAKIGSLLIGTYGVSNYTGLKLNNVAADLVVPDEAVAVLGVVTL